MKYLRNTVNGVCFCSVITVLIWWRLAMGSFGLGFENWTHGHVWYLQCGMEWNGM